MKIEIEIPDFVPSERIIYIFAGIEKIGWIEPHTRKVFVKTSRCSQCGRCCARLDCPELTKEVGDNDLWTCDRMSSRPFLCCATEPRNIPECSSLYAEMI